MNRPTVEASALVWWAMRDIRDRYLRLLQSFEELSAAASRGGRQVFAAAAATLSGDLSAFENEARNLGIAFISTAIEDGQLWTAVSRPRQHRRQYAATAAQLFPYLPFPPHPPEDMRFFLIRCLGLSPYPEEDNRLFSLSYSGKPFWEMQELPLYSNPFVAVVPVPFPESLTPLRWPLLVHELGHVIDGRGENIPPQLRDKIRQNLASALTHSGLGDDEVGKIADELIADAVAYRACGRAFLYAFATEALFQDQYLPRAAHLAAPALADARTRINLLDPSFAVLDEFAEHESPDGKGLESNRMDNIRDHLFQAIRAEDVDVFAAEDLANQAMSEIGALAAPARPVLPREFLDDKELATQVGEQVHKDLFEEERTSPQDEDTVAKLRLDLQSWPAPGVLVADGRRDSVVHTPASDAEILTAAWELSLQGDADHQRELFVGECVLDAQQEIDVDAAMRRVVRIDTNVTRSLETAAVHRWLSRWMIDDEENGEAGT